MPSATDGPAPLTGEEFRAKVRSLGHAGLARAAVKTTVMRDGAHSARVVEHRDGRVDVTIANPPTTPLRSAARAQARR